MRWRCSSYRISTYHQQIYVGLYKGISHPAYSVNYPFIRTQTWTSWHYNVREYLNLTIWANRYSWPIRSSHFLLLVHFWGHCIVGKFTGQHSQVSHYWTCILWSRYVVYGSFYLLMWVEMLSPWNIWRVVSLSQCELRLLHGGWKWGLESWTSAAWEFFTQTDNRLCSLWEDGIR